LKNTILSLEKQGERATYWQRGERKIRFCKSQTPRPITSPRKRQVSGFFTLYSLPKTWSDKIKPCKKMEGEKIGDCR
jgi:hypothetical protein